MLKNSELTMPEIAVDSPAVMPFRATAEALIETLFPAGDRLPAANVSVLMSQVEQYIGDNRWFARGVGAGLGWLESQSLLRTGQRFSKASPEQREQLLKSLQSSFVSANMLRGLTAPFKTAYCFQDHVLATVRGKQNVRVPSQVETFRWQSQVTDVEALDESEQLECDVVVIGTGAGGAAAAYELASRGLAVVMLEEGKYYDRRDFSGDLMQVIPKLYRHSGATASMGNVVIPIPIGKNVGGTTTINSGTCMRTPDSVLSEWRSEGLNDFTPQALAPIFDEVEAMLKVQTANPKYVGEIGRTIAQGAHAIGLKETYDLRRNAEGCDGQGLCQFGCPTDAKQSTNVSYVPRALDFGAFLFTGFRAEQLIRNGDSVTGVESVGRKANGQTVKLRIDARHVVVSMGTFITPMFLQQNRIQHRMLGGNLSVHPAGAVVGMYEDREFDNGHTIPQGYGVADLKQEGIIFEGGTPPFAAHGLMNPFVGKDYVTFTERFQNAGYFGFMIKDSSRGRVRKAPFTDMPLITYNMNRLDLERFKKAVDTLARIHFAAGAKQVHIGGLNKTPLIHNESELSQVMSGPLKPRDFLMTAYHPLGTARIGADPQTSVCDPWHRVRGVEGLSVMDGSSVPSSLGANPQVTIMTLATRASRRLAEELLEEEG